ARLGRTDLAIAVGAPAKELVRLGRDAGVRVSGRDLEGVGDAGDLGRLRMIGEGLRRAETELAVGVASPTPQLPARADGAGVAVSDGELGRRDDRAGVAVVGNAGIPRVVRIGACITNRRRRQNRIVAAGTDAAPLVDL